MNASQLVLAEGMCANAHRMWPNAGEFTSFTARRERFQTIRPVLTAA
jgi:hypothetical protein